MTEVLGRMRSIGGLGSPVKEVRQILCSREQARRKEGGEEKMQRLRHKKMLSYTQKETGPRQL